MNNVRTGVRSVWKRSWTFLGVILQRFGSERVINIYICGHTSSYMSMLDSSLLGNEKLRGQVVHNVGEVKKKAGLARSPSVFTEHISSTYTCNHLHQINGKGSPG